MAKNYEYYTMRVVRPPGVSAAWMKAYIKEAVNGWCGQYEVDDPMFDLLPVKVTKQKKS